MALEDLCISSQSGPSPMKLSLSTESLTSPQILDMSFNNKHLRKSKMENLSVAATFERYTYKIKEEEIDSMSDEEETINVDDQITFYHTQSTSSQIETKQKSFNFSISNILSDQFGRWHKKKHFEPNLLSEAKFSEKNLNRQTLATPLFRPFESNKNVQLNHRFSNSVDTFEYSRVQQQVAAVVMIAEQENLTKNINPNSYPRISEEILNNKWKYKNQSSQNLPAPSLNHASLEASSPESLEQNPPLGSLCKTVSQIGEKLSSNKKTLTITSKTSQLYSSSPSTNISSSLISPISSYIPSSISASPICLNSSLQPLAPQSISRDSGMESSDETRSETSSTTKDENSSLWPAWVYCTRYSDRPSSGPRYRRPKQPKEFKGTNEDKRPRTAFSSDQLSRLKREFNENRYLTERRRQQLSSELGLNEAQIKIWFQNKRAKIKKSNGHKNPLALQLMAQGLYNHSTVPLTKEEEELEMRLTEHISL